MKKILFLLLATGLLFSSCSITSKIGKQESFTGKITYKITFPDSDFSDAQLAQMPSRSTLIIGNNKTKSVLRSGMITQMEIKDLQTQNTTALIEAMGQKFAIDKTKESIEKELAEKGIAEVTILEETKEIAGYTCQKAIIKLDGEKNNIFFSKEIGDKAMNYGSSQYQNLDGIPLEYTIKSDRITMKMTATKIEKSKVADSEFEIPEGFTKVTMDELKSMFGS